MSAYFENLASDYISAETSNLNLIASSSIYMNSPTIELPGNIIVNSNIAINETLYLGGLNIFREFDEGHTISYGMQISDNEKLQFYKHDTRLDKAILVSELGINRVATTNAEINQSATTKLNGLFTAASNVNKRANRPN